nr:hypothetical protein [Tanacetum cinerariifolium]
MEAGSKDRNPTFATVRVFETYNNVEQEIRNQLNAEAEAVQIILTGIDNDIYLTVDACPNACEMWKEIERLKQGESINFQDLETNLFWEFGYKLGWKDKPILDSEGNPTTTTQQPEWQRFVTLMKQSQELKHVSYHKLYDILKQHQHEVNEIRAEKIARVANPLALVAQQQQVYHPQSYPTQYNQHSSTKTHQAATRKREKAIENSPQPVYDQEPSMVDDDEDTSKDKEIDKLMALISLSRANQDNSLRIHRNAGYEGQRCGTVAGARETVGSSMVRKSRIQCYNCKEYGHVARECQRPKRAKDAAYHREKIEQINPNDEDVDLAKERELLASLIAKLKCEID